VNGLTMIDPKRKKHVINVTRPLVFDNRLLPKSFEGLEVKAVISGDMPMEFKIDRTKPDWQKSEYIWAPERFENFVDRCSDDIKKKLGNPKMTRDEVLAALCFGNYEEHKKKTQQLIKEGKIPSYRKN